MTISELEEMSAVSNENYDQWCSDTIKKYPLLTKEEEHELAQRCAAGDEDAVRLMVNSNLRLVTYFAKKFRSLDVPFTELLQEGFIGLMEAAKRFSPSAGTRFSTFARYWIEKYFLLYLSNYFDNKSQGSRRTMEKKRKLNSMVAEFYKEHGKDCPVEQLALQLGESVETTKKIMELSTTTVSLDEPIYDSDGKAIAMKDILADQDAASPSDPLVRRELNHSIAQLLGMLNPRQQSLLRLRFGMEDGVCYNLSQIGKMMGISKQRALQIEKQALDMLQKNCEGLGLEDFLG